MINYIRALYRDALTSIPPSLSLKLQHLKSTGRWPDIAQPRTFNEKILLRKLTENSSLYTLLSDKSSVKDYVRKILGSEFVIPTLWEGTALPSAPPSSVQVPYVLKASHASGWNYFVHDSSTDWSVLMDVTKQWMSKPWYKHLHERWYNRAERKIIIEPFIGVGRTPPEDIKFFVFSGKVELIQFDSGRATDHRRDMFDRNWNRLNFRLKYPNCEREPNRPKHLDDMIRMSELLSGGMAFVRVDLYETINGVRFGEMTFSPGGGFERFLPASVDYEVGKLWVGSIE